MALSAQNDSGQSGAEDTNMVKQQDIINELRNKVNCLTLYQYASLLKTSMKATGKLVHSACIVLDAFTPIAIVFISYAVIF